LAGLTTHVLDTAAGRPAAGVAVRLFRVGPDGAAEPLKEARTNADGRCDAPLLGADELTSGRYRLDFAAGDYFRGTGADLPDPPFLDVVSIGFGVAEPEGHYHVPLLISPYGYSTYRGS